MITDDHGENEMDAQGILSAKKDLQISDNLTATVGGLFYIAQIFAG